MRKPAAVATEVEAPKAPVASRRAEVFAGLRIAAPLILGYIPVAFAFGILGRVSGVPDWVTVAMSLFVYGGASQFAALQLLPTGNLGALIMTTFIINSRHLLLAASIAPKLRSMTLLQRTWFSVELTDEAFALHDSRYRKQASPSLTETFVANGAVHVSWVLGTLLGIAFGNLLPGLDDLGLEFALTAMFIAILFIDVLKTPIDCVVAACGGVLAVAVTLTEARIWATVIAAPVAATVGWLLARRKQNEEETGE